MSPPDALGRAVRAVLTVAGLLVPADQRSRFKREWTAELGAHARWLENGGRRRVTDGLLVQALGAVVEGWRLRWEDSVEMFLMDLRFALRGLMRRPAFAFLAVVTMGLGIGASSAIYSVVDGVLLRPLPYHDPGRLVLVQGVDRSAPGGPSSPPVRTSEADFRDYELRGRVLESLVGYESWTRILRVGDGTPEWVPGIGHTEGLFKLLGSAPVLGRGFTVEEHEMRAEVAVLSYALWASRFGSDPGVLGRTITLDDNAFTIIGVMESGFNFPGDAQFWMPTNARPGDDDANASDDSFGRDWRTMSVLGRISDGRSMDDADRDMKRVAAELEAEFPTTNTNHSVQVRGLLDVTVASARAPLVALLVAVGLLLIIACANVGGLLLVRTSGRQGEVAIRTALGAGRGRVVRQFLTESLLLAALGGLVGLVIGRVSLAFFLDAAPMSIPRSAEIGLDGRVTAVMSVVTVIAGVVFGLAPAFRAARGDNLAVLRDGGRGATTGRGRQRFLSALVVAQVALSTVLVVGAGLFTTSFARLMAVDHGYQTDQLMTFQLNIGFERYPGWDQFTDFFQRARVAVAEIPGVEAVEHINVTPLRPGWTEWYHVEGTPELERGARPLASLRAITPGFFELAGLDLVLGRAFDGGDDRQSTGAAIVNETFAQQVFGSSGSALGQQLEKPQFWGADYPSVHRIVGVVGDSNSDGLGTSPSPTIYFPFEQMPFGGNTLFLKTDLTASRLAPMLRETVLALDPLLPVQELKSVEELVDDSVAENRFAMLLAGAFGVFALLLANIGLHGVVSYMVAERTRELGLRKALGADNETLMLQVLGRGILLTLAGVAVGLGVAVLAAGVVESALFGVSPSDPATYTIVLAMFVVGSVVASWVPANRAVAVDPLQAMSD